MLQTIQTLHTYSILYPSLYFSFLALLTCIVCPGWYRLGRLQLASVSTSPIAPARPRCVFRRQSHALLLLLAHLAIVAMAEAKDDLVIFTLAIKVT